MMDERRAAILAKTGDGDHRDLVAEVERLKGELAERDEAREVLAGNATLEQDAFDENVAVRIPIKAWRTFWELPLSARDPQRKPR